MLDFFEASEWADIFWIIISLCFIFLNKKIRASFLVVVKQLFSQKFLIIFASAFAYICGCVFILKTFGFWNLTLLKETLLWIFLASTVMMYNIVFVKSAKYFFIDVLNDAFKWIVTIEFAIGLHSSSFWFEFFFVPIFLFFGLLIGFGERDKKNQNIIKIIKGLVLISGSLIFLYRVLDVFLNIKSHLKIDVLKQFMLAPLLTLAFIPFLYVFFLYVKYGIVYMSINNFIISKKLRIYTKTQLLWKFNFDLNGLQRVRDELVRNGEYSIQSINNSIYKIKKAQKAEKNPPVVDPAIGWSPYVVKDYLKSQGLNTRDYFNYSDNDWHSGSDYLKLEDGLISNVLAFYINGNSEIANSLKLILNIHNLNSKDSSHGFLLSNAKIIFKNITTSDMSNDISNAILKGINLKKKLNLIEVSVEKSIWPTNRGYQVTFEIKHVIN